MDRSTLRARSKSLLGNAYRLELAAEIAARPDEAVFAQELADATGIRYPRVQEELKRLESAGLLQLASGHQGRAVPYKVVPSAYWGMCAALMAELAGDQ